MKPAVKLIACWLLLLQLGCEATQKRKVKEGTELEISAVALEVEYPDAHTEPCGPAVHTMAPRTLKDGVPTEYWELSLEEVIDIALRNSDVFRSLGGAVLANPDGAASVFDPALRHSDPQFGVEGALSAFDTQLAMDMFWSRNDQLTNNIIIGGGIREIVQDQATFQSSLSRTAVTGTQFSISNQTQYDQSNQPGNLFTSGWDTQFDMTVRQPLLQGAGVAFNRIAGPNAQPGFNFSSGVLIARINTDISIVDFEQQVRQFISDVEDAYWEVYFAYHVLDANILSRDLALETWRKTRPRAPDIPGGEAANEAQARDQYYAAQDSVQNALIGSPGTGLGAFSTQRGVYESERQLRLLMGLPVNDGRLIRPNTEPPSAEVAFQWEACLAEALTRRAEIRRQKWQIKRRELELVASKNFLLPRLDVVGLYRWRGFGDNLTGDTPFPGASAFQDLGTGDHQEWQISLDFDMSLGYRRAWAGVKRSELQLARDRALLRQQEITISHDLAATFHELKRTHQSVEMRFNRLNAAVQRQLASEAAYRADRITLFELLQSQNALTAAQTAYFEALAGYARAIKNVHEQKGSLLAYNGVYLSESAWPHEAYEDAAKLRQRWRPKTIDYRFNRPGIISRGAYPQSMVAAKGAANAPVSPETIPTPAPPVAAPVPEKEEMKPIPLRSTKAGPPPVLLGASPALRRLPSVNLTESLQSIAKRTNRNSNQPMETVRPLGLPIGRNQPTYPGAQVGFQQQGRQGRQPQVQFAAPVGPVGPAPIQPTPTVPPGNPFMAPRSR